MRTVQTEPNFTSVATKKVTYSDAVSVTLPKLEETNDSVHVRMHVLGTGAAMSLTLGAVTLSGFTFTVANSARCQWDFMITNIGSGSYLVVGTAIEEGGDAEVITYVDTTNDYSSSGIQASLSPAGASSHYSFAAV